MLDHSASLYTSNHDLILSQNAVIDTTSQTKNLKRIHSPTSIFVAAKKDCNCAKVTLNHNIITINNNNEKFGLFLNSLLISSLNSFTDFFSIEHLTSLLNYLSFIYHSTSSIANDSLTLDISLSENPKHSQNSCILILSSQFKQISKIPTFSYTKVAAINVPTSSKPFPTTQNPKHIYKLIRKFKAASLGKKQVDLIPQSTLKFLGFILCIQYNKYEAH